MLSPYIFYLSLPPSFSPSLLSPSLLLSLPPSLPPSSLPPLLLSLPPAVQVSCGFEGSTSYIVQETSGEFELCVGVYPALRFNFTVNITTVDGSASESDIARQFLRPLSLCESVSDTGKVLYILCLSACLLGRYYFSRHCFQYQRCKGSLLLL